LVDKLYATLIERSMVPRLRVPHEPVVHTPMGL
jgi:hypothetical protein